jgi:hypothetical protein
MAEKPNAKNSATQRELDKAEAQFDAFDKNIKDLNMDAMQHAPKQELEPQTKISQRDLDRNKPIYLKPKRSYPPGVHPKTGEREKFNERFRDEYNFAREYVEFIAENIEIIGESIKLSLKKFPGTAIEDWEIPVNVPVMAPRMVAERLTGCGYHILKMEDRVTHSEGFGTFTGQMVAKSKVQRLDARPVSSRRSLFMGNSDFDYSNKKTA